MSAAEVRSLISSSKEFRDETERLYMSIYHQKLNKSCGDCWLDAYVLIMKGNSEKQKAMAQKRFNLRAGAVLTDPYGDKAKTITHHNVTDDLALYHLRTHPDCIKMFSEFPEDWETLARKSAKEQPIKIEVPEDNSDLDNMSDEERDIFEGYKRSDRDRIREIVTKAKTPEDALASCSVLESEGFNSAAEKIRAIAQKELEDRKMNCQAEANEKAVTEFKEAVEAIGDVTADDDCKARIDKAKELYKAMNDEQKKLAVDLCAKLDEAISAHQVTVERAEAAANAGALADNADTEAPAEAPAEGGKPADGKENKKNNVKK